MRARPQPPNGDEAPQRTRALRAAQIAGFAPAVCAGVGESAEQVIRAAQQLTGPFEDVVLRIAQVERWLSPLQDIDDQLRDLGVFDAPGGVGDPIALRLVDACVNDLVCVTDDGKVRVVRHDHDLPPVLRVFDRRNEQRGDRLVVQVLFWLVDYERDISPIDQQVEDEQESPSLSR